MDETNPIANMPADFSASLYHTSVPDDLAQYDDAALAAFATQAWGFLNGFGDAVDEAIPHTDAKSNDKSNDKFKAARLRFVDVDVVPSNPLSYITILEVINPDRPFLVDSTLACLEQHGCKIRLIAHPVFELERTDEGKIASCAIKAKASVPAKFSHMAKDSKAEPHKSAESFIHIHLERISDDRVRGRLLEDLRQTYVDVASAVDDWRAMRQKIRTIIVEYQEAPPLPVDEIAEAIQFLQWLVDDNFTLLGVRELAFQSELDSHAPHGLGLFRDVNHPVIADSFSAHRGTKGEEQAEGLDTLLEHRELLIITKTVVKSRVHRRVFMDYIGIKRFDGEGNVAGELALIGLLTSDAYTHSTQSIPYIRQKVAQVLATAQLEMTSHAGRSLLAVLESYPRDELFQLDVPTLYSYAAKIASLAERPKLCVLARRDLLGRFVSLIVYVPRERFDLNVMHKIGALCARVSGGIVRDVAPFFPGGPMVRIQFLISDIGNFYALLNVGALEREISTLLQTWRDGLVKALVSKEGRAQKLMRRYLDAFSLAYQDKVPTLDAVRDIEMMEQLNPARPRAFFLSGALDTQDIGNAVTDVRLKIYSLSEAIALSRCVPVLEAMGFYVVNEYSFEIAPNFDDGRDTQSGKATLWLHDLTIRHAQNKAFVLDPIASSLESHLAAIFRGDAERDGFCALTLHAGLGWRDVALIRALARYLRQAGVGYAQDFLSTTLVRHAEIAQKLVGLFYLRFDSRGAHAIDERARAAQSLVQGIEQALAAVTSLDEDRILRRFLNLITCVVRTNFFQLGADGYPRTLISFKFKSAGIDDLPKPTPLYEIFVCSPVLEGVHLRFGKVARGGLRWSDRSQDFRTEILGLVKAQQVKNALIVPVGAKGGFVGKKLPPPSDREAYMREGIAVYQQFVQALLDLTDNIVAGAIVKPSDVLCYDGDDPYLVVAADKGTATFSDTANALSIAHKFWLDDAFASGGSVGYDHKKMGITARGAWEAVKRHFREMNRDIQTTPFTCAGVGDMSGDVFGNGMLLSPATKLIAAFDHRDIFIDPDPDPALSLAERTRLFNLPRSSWQDYDTSLISKGGGVYPRSLKEIELSNQARVALGLEEAKLSPQKLMQAILRAPVDLLWFGGIGTYIKSAAEGDDSVGDRANDAIRINALELKAKVIGEGANLGMTQRGRIEAGLAGVRLNTDAIDNSAGVNTSDVEVNIKIALSVSRQSGALQDETRAQLLAELTDDVARLVLRNNYAQTLSLSLTQKRGARENFWLEHVMQSLEAEGRLDRKLEFLPDDAALEARTRQNQGLSRPELAVLLAYTKLALNDLVVESALPDDPYFRARLQAYFPQKLARHYPEAVLHHRLKREIIATGLANDLINIAGITGLSRAQASSGADARAIVRAFVIIHDVFGLETILQQISALDAKIDGTVQLELYARVQNFVLERLAWFARVLDGATPLQQQYERFAALASLDAAAVRAVLSAREKEFFDGLVQDLLGKNNDGAMSENLAHALAMLELTGSLCDAALIAEQDGHAFHNVLQTVFALQDLFLLRKLRRDAQRLAAEDYYDRLARDRALAGIEECVRTFARRVQSQKQSSVTPTSLEAMLMAQSEMVKKSYHMLRDLLSQNLSIARLTIIASLFLDIVNT